MRLSEVFIRIGAFAVAAALCAGGAIVAVDTVETRSVAAVETALQDNELGFASVIGDGLQIVLEGEAPSEAQRFRAISIAGTQVDASRVIDNMSVQDSAAITPPEFSIELLRNDSGISIIGLVPSSVGEDALNESLLDLVDDESDVVDLMERADYPIPDGWQQAVDYALVALRELPRSKISVRPGRVRIDAISDSEVEKARIERRLLRARPTGVQADLQISSPRPVITPFTTRFVKTADDAFFESCVADTEEARDDILAAAARIGVEGEDCTIALGTPTPRWADAVEKSIAAINELGGGTVTLSDADITVIGPENANPANFDRIMGELQNSLPDVFVLEASVPQVAQAGEDGPPQFIATRSPEGLVQLRGRVADELMNTTAHNYALAKFGGDVSMGTRIVDGLPRGWAVRVLAAVEALSYLSNGSVVVEPNKVVVRGNTGNEEASAEISRLLVDKLGEADEFEIDIVYVEELDPIAALPTDEECIAQIQNVTSSRKITFDPGSVNISGDSLAIVDDIAEILRKCSDLRIEIAGYTDSQGREEMNQQLSQQRAEAVLAALRVRRVPTATFRAVGYGEADPIADNDTEAGREANRRIEFSLIQSETSQEPTTLEESEAPTTEETASE